MVAFRCQSMYFPDRCPLNMEIRVVIIPTPGVSQGNHFDFACIAVQTGNRFADLFVNELSASCTFRSLGNVNTRTSMQKTTTPMDSERPNLLCSQRISFSAPKPTIIVEGRMIRTIFRFSIDQIFRTKRYKA